MPRPDPCSELAMLVTRLAMHIGTRPEIKSLADIAAEMRKEIPEITRDEIVKSIVEATTGKARDVSELSKKLADLKREAKNDRNLRAAIDTLQRHLGKGTLPEPKAKSSPTPPAEIADLRKERDALLAAVRKSEPAIREKYEKQISELTDRLNDAELAPPVKRESAPLSKELERLAYERDRLRRQINDRIRGMKPAGFWTRAAEPLNLARAVMTSFDYSAVLRQGGFIAIGNPRRALAAFPDMFRAGFSEKAAHAIDAEIHNRPNAPLYARSKLYIAPSEFSGRLSAQEEAYMSRLAGKIPGVAGSQRAYTAYLNRLRADTFDAMTETLARGGEVTQPEANAIANYINVATGRGVLGKAEPAAVALNTVFFSPRYVASRFEILAGQPFYRGTARTRVLIAKEYGKYLAGMGVLYGLSALAGHGPETDPRSSDFGKIRIGNTRIDPLSGLAQTATFTARIASGENKRQSGEVVPIRGPGVPYGGMKSSDVIARFLRTKLSPTFGAAVDVAAGENAIGQPVTPTQVATRLVVPLSFGDIYDAMREHGVPEGAAIGTLSIFGAGVQVQTDKHGRFVSGER